jgi:tetratricopeptide (TPR) repeat protein
MNDFRPPAWTDDQLRLLPLLRVVSKFGFFGWYDSVTAIYPNQIIRGWTKQLEPLHVKTGDPVQFSKRLHETSGFPIDNGTIVQLFPGGRFARKATIRLRGEANCSFAIPHDQCTHVASYFLHTRRDNFKLESRVPFHVGGILLFLFIIGLALSALAFAPIPIELSSFVRDSLEASPPAEEVVPLGTFPETNPQSTSGSTVLENYLSRQAATVIGITAAFVAMFAASIVIIDHLPCKFPWISPANQRHRTKHDGLYFHSKLLGWTLKFLGFAAFMGFWISFVQFQMPLILLGVPASFGLILLGRSFSGYTIKPDGRAPNSVAVLIRSAHPDPARILAPETLWGALSDIRWIRSVGWPWKLFMLMNPIAALRAMCGRGPQEVGEQLLRFFERKRHKSVPWINHSRETDDSPVDRELQAEADSRIVALYPTKAEPWPSALSRAFRSVDKSKLLFVLADFYRDQEAFEDFRMIVESETDLKLPPFAGLTSSPGFIFFDNRNEACLRSTCFINALQWPIRNNVVDFNTTFKHFLKPQAERRIDAKVGIVPLGFSSHFDLSATALYSCACLIFAVFFHSMLAASFSIDTPASRFSSPSNTIAIAPPGPSNNSEKLVIQRNRTAEKSLTTADIQTKLAMADVAFGKGDYATMEQLLDEILKLDSDNPRALFFQAMLLKQQSQSDRARTVMEHVVELDPDNSSYWAFLGLLQLQLKDYQSTIAACNRALGLEPGLVNAILNRGQAYFDLGQSEAALRDAETALKRTQGVDRSAGLGLAGLALAKLNRLDESLSRLSERVRIDPNNPIAHRSLAELNDLLNSRSKRDPDLARQASQAYEKTVESSPSSTEAELRYAVTLGREGKLLEAKSAIERLLKVNPSNVTAINEYAGVFRLMGQYLQSENYYRNAIEIAPDNREIHLNLAIVQIARGDWKGALASLKIANGIGVADPISSLQNSLLLYELGQDKQAYSSRSEGLPLILASNKPGTQALCMIWLLLGEHDETLIREVLSKNPIESTSDEQVAIRIIRSGLFARIGKLNEAASLLRGLNEKTLPPAQLLLSRLFKAQLAADSNREELAADLFRSVENWFVKECPPSFAEGTPETFPHDWVSRLAFRRLYLTYKSRLREQGVDLADKQ